MMKGLEWLHMLLHIVGIALFLKGFFPVKVAVPGHATWLIKSIEPNITKGKGKEMGTKLKPQFNRLIFVLIDALRADFVLPTESIHDAKMSFVLDKIKKKSSYSFLAKAHPPTVTMPRIKALTTGGIPGFVDVVLNFDSKSLTEDNIVTQLKLAGKKIVFYGDDTWMRLFPDHFHKSDGTTSFFVTDYTEVDHNVTMHLDEDLTLDADWNVMILHYLGLDHIGHLAGPQSPLVQPKLDEMDRIIRRLYEFIEQKDQSDSQSSLLVVCGDHGMSDQGSHGGSTYSETATPYVLLSPAFESDDVKTDSHLDISTVYQIDMVPTLSLCLGLPIPQNNLGILPEAVLNELSDREKLQWMYINAQQLNNVFKMNQQNTDSSPEFHAVSRVIEQHRSWLENHMSSTNPDRQESLHLLATKITHGYRTAMVQMRDVVAQSLSNYDLHAMAVAICIIWMAMLSLAVVAYKRPNGAILKTSSCTVPVAAAFGALVLGLQISACTSTYSSDLICDGGVIGVFVAVILLVGVCLVVYVVTCESDGGNTMQRKLKQTTSASEANFSRLLIAGVILHTFSVLSSSFIEEEHQTWYFLTQTLHVTSFAYFIFLHVNSKSKWVDSKEKPSETNSAISERDDNYLYELDINRMEFSQSGETDITMLERIPIKSRNRTKFAKSANNFIKLEENSRITTKDGLKPEQCHGRTGNNRLKPEQRDRGTGNINKNNNIIGIFYCTCLAILCRVSRTWNQTGDKWAYLPDIGDWLIRPENKHILSYVSAASLLVACSMIVFEPGFKINWIQRMLFCIGTLGVYSFRAAIGDLLLPVLYNESNLSKGVFEADVVYLLVFFIIIIGIIRSSSWTSVNNQRQAIDNFESRKSKESRESVESRIRLEILYSSLQTAFVLVVLLLMRSHNISLVAMELVQLWLLRQIVRCMDIKNVTMVTLMYLWMGQAAFFYQGNSNSIATVDVSSGYVGVANYWPPVIGLLMCLSTYSGPIMWHLGLVITLGRISSRFKIRLNSVIDQSIIAILLCRILPVAIYVILVTTQRYHLFVWTVFSPKLLYEFMHSFVTAVMVTLVLLAERMSR